MHQQCSRLGENLISAAQTHSWNGPTAVELIRSAVRELAEVPIKPPNVTEMDLIRARQLVRALAPLKRLSCDDAEIVARAIAGSFAEGRQRGLDIAKFDLQA